jgi:hypothetical protein
MAQASVVRVFARWLVPGLRTGMEAQGGQTFRIVPCPWSNDRFAFALRDSSKLPPSSVPPPLLRPLADAHPVTVGRAAASARNAPLSPPPKPPPPPLPRRGAVPQQNVMQARRCKQTRAPPHTRAVLYGLAFLERPVSNAWAGAR